MAAMAPMDRLTKLRENLPEMLRRVGAGEPPLFPPADPLQYPKFLIPDIPSKPWFEAEELAWTRAFTESHVAICAELEAFLAQQAVTFRNYIGPIDHGGADAGAWHVLYLDYRGRRWEQHCAQFPRLMALLETVPRRSGTAFISRLTPGAHIPKHSGATNTQLTCHFGLVVPDRVEMRVGHEIRRQVAGHCSVFDDSFEHEVWNHSDRDRYNVFMQFWHPDLSDAEVAGIQELEKVPAIQAVIAQYLEGAVALAPVGN